jgi:hypothetical protein
MQNYYEILDYRYWTEERQDKIQTKPRNNSSREVFQVITLMGLTFLFWGLSERLGLKYTMLLNLIGWFFGLWSLIVVNTNPSFQKK